ncbi:hypothetical protein E1B28_002453 [Marasmius oreades]|uniref:Uncharacterized protein n=1 Tax=Marasmius oreades TaxID=181124 RepID=A0A9P7RNN9_9AGAR|nr:uncharacterized protein E1B28_002453 [Marasmius oreades]KAG7086500.1 hypothetical protein E1B28_002453 [Marasmius oreades]
MTGDELLEQDYSVLPLLTKGVGGKFTMVYNGLPDWDDVGVYYDWTCFRKNLAKFETAGIISMLTSLQSIFLAGSRIVFHASFLERSPQQIASSAGMHHNDASLGIPQNGRLFRTLRYELSESMMLLSSHQVQPDDSSVEMNGKASARLTRS